VFRCVALAISLPDLGTLLMIITSFENESTNQSRASLGESQTLNRSIDHLSLVFRYFVFVCLVSISLVERKKHNLINTC